MKKRLQTVAEIEGIALGLFAILVAVLALTPEEWSTRLEIWRTFLGPKVVLILTLLAGLLSGIELTLFIQGRAEKKRPHLITAALYQDEVRKFIDSGHYRILKVFGYTGETVWADLMRFGDRYRELEVRMLHRNWTSEAFDERAYNQDIKQGRLWSKSAEIRRFGMQPWPHALKRFVRYYSHQPILKGIILCKPLGEGRVVFLSCYHWIARPAEGGSPFKGADMQMLMMDDEMPGARRFIDYIESQFDYEWENSPTPQQLVHLGHEKGQAD